MIDEQEFMTSLSVKTWVGGLPSGSLRTTTRLQYPRRLKDFCEWTGKTPDMLIEQRKTDLKSEDPRTRHSLEIEVKRFISVLSEKGLAPGTVKTYAAIVCSFFRRNYYPLEFFRGDKPRGETTREGTRAASKEDIRLMVEVAPNPRVRALILFMKDTGLAEADVSKLTLGNLFPRPSKTIDISQVFSLEVPVPLVLRRQKTKMSTITFMGKEAFDALKSTLKMRVKGSPDFVVRKGGKRNGDISVSIPEETLTPSSPLFRSYHMVHEHAADAKNVRSLSARAISTIIRRVAITAGVWSEGFSGHALRKFFQTSLENAGISANWVKKMMGHSLGESEEPYSQPKIEALRDAYVKGYANLAVSEVAESRSRVEFLEKQVEQLSMNGHNKKTEIETMKEQIQTLQKSKDDVMQELLGKMEKMEETVQKMKRVMDAND